jgi:predicted AAA+ superfamily ATPase
MLLDELRSYFFVGGMPECVKIYSQSGKFQSAFEIQEQLVDAYRQDFSKYAPYSDKRCLNAVFTNIAKSIGQQIKYSRLTDGFTTPTIKKAFDLLTQAKVINKVSSASPAGLPLGSSASEKKFKATLVDIGLVHYLCGMFLSNEFKKKKVIYLLFTREPLQNNLLVRKYWQQGMAIYFTGPGMQKAVPQK